MLTHCVFSGFNFAPGDSFGWNLLYCNATVKDIRYQYNATDGTFQTLSATDASLHLTKLVSALTDSGLFGINMAIDRSVNGQVGGTSADYAAAYALELSRQLIAMTASVWEPAPAQSVHIIKRALGAEIKLVPLALYILGVLLFWSVSILRSPA